jgi:hypothetical protein
MDTSANYHRSSDDEHAHLCGSKNEVGPEIGRTGGSDACGWASISRSLERPTRAKAWQGGPPTSTSIAEAPGPRPSAPMTPEDSQTETGEVLLAPFDFLLGRTSESTRAKTAETFFELLGARVRNPNTRSAYRVAWRSFLAFCSARRLELESVRGR